MLETLFRSKGCWKLQHAPRDRQQLCVKLEHDILQRPTYTMQVKACTTFTFCPKIQGLLGVKLQLADQELDLTLIDCYNRINSWSIWSRPIHQSI
jgi:hypothetical protein